MADRDTGAYASARRAVDDIEERDAAAYVAEFLGTFFLVFFVCTIVTLHSADGLGITDWAVVGLVHVFLLAMLIYTFGGGSGAHFNPAVTIALTALRRARAVDSVVYVLVQLAGAVLGALVCKLLLDNEGEGVANYGATLISQNFLEGEWLPGFTAEFIGTFLLMSAIMATAVNVRANLGQWTGLVVGMTLGFIVMTFGPLTGGSFNPARSFGPALASGEWADFWVYVVAPVLGALAAAFAYRFLILLPQEKQAQGAAPTGSGAAGATPPATGRPRGAVG